MRLRGRVAIVTGSSRGIGRAIAQAFALEGAAVVLNASRSIGDARVAAAAIGKAGGKAIAVQADMGKPQEAQGLVTQAIDELGRLDILVNNAGWADRGELWQIDEARWARMLAVHVTGPFFASRAASECMIRQGRGVIINIASMRGMEPGTGPLHYNVSKAALLMLTKCLARDLAPHVRVNAIAPGYTETALHAERTIVEREQIASRIPIGRFSLPEEIAQVALFLASDEAAFITGQTIVASGGVVTG
jgi:3-oxoacyl-[acyl-carrier protein] reductase